MTRWMAKGNSASQSGGVARRAAAPFELTRVQRPDRSGALGARLSSSKQSGGAGHSHLGLDGSREATTRAHDGDFLPCSMNSNEGGAPVILWPRRGVRQHQGTPAVLLVPAVELDRPQNNVAALRCSVWRW
jgi:hypothetical protein